MTSRPLTYDFEKEWTRFRYDVWRTYLTSIGITEKQIQQQVRGNRDYKGTVQQWGRRRLPTTMCALRVDKNGSAPKLFASPLWRFLSPRPLRPSRVDKLLKPLRRESPLRFNPYDLTGWDVDEAHSKLILIDETEPKAMFYRGGIDAFAILLATIRFPNCFPENNWPARSIEFLIRSLPGICRSPFIGKLGFCIIDAICDIVSALPESPIAPQMFASEERNCYIDKDVLMTQAVSPLFEPVEALRVRHTMTGQPIRLANPVVHLEAALTPTQAAKVAVSSSGIQTDTEHGRLVMQQFFTAAIDWKLPQCDWESTLDCDSTELRKLANGTSSPMEHTIERIQQFIDIHKTVCERIPDRERRRIFVNNSPVYEYFTLSMLAACGAFKLARKTLSAAA